MALHALPPKVLGVRGQLGDLVELDRHTPDESLNAVVVVAHLRVALEQLDAHHQVRSVIALDDVPEYAHVIVRYQPQVFTQQ